MLLSGKWRFIAVIDVQVVEHTEFASWWLKIVDGRTFTDYTLQYIILDFVTHFNQTKKKQLIFNSTHIKQGMHHSMCSIRGVGVVLKGRRFSV